MYAIVDIETTGGEYNKESITEIAVYKHDGLNVTDQFISLLNPEKTIQPFVEKLTGINSKMLRNAPRFFEVAKRIIVITENCLIVAHNADFDYRILRTEFKRLGYNFERDSLCTVKLSQKLLPDMESYKLSNLVRLLGIPLSRHHRAKYDALATVKLFELLLEKDSSKEVVKSQINSINTYKSSSKHLSIIEELPSACGVYYIHNQMGDLLYIGIGKNIQKRVRSHLIGTDYKSKEIKNKLHKVKFEITGSELIATLKEQNEIKKNQPQINKDSHYPLYPIGIRIDKKSFYHQLVLEQVRSKKDYLLVFKNRRVAKKTFTQLVETYQLFHNFSTLQNPDSACYVNNNDKCKDIFLEEDKQQIYNQRIMQIEEKNNYPYDNFLMIGNGRKDGEWSFIYIENQHFRGYGFYELNHQINNKEKILNRMISIEDNSDCRALIMVNIKKRKYIKLIPLR